MELFPKKMLHLHYLEKIVIQGGKMMGTMCFCVCVCYRKFLQLSMSFPQWTLRMLRDLPRLLREAIDLEPRVSIAGPPYTSLSWVEPSPLWICFFLKIQSRALSLTGDFLPFFLSPFIGGFRKCPAAKKKSWCSPSLVEHELLLKEPQDFLVPPFP